jgi:hypothetical protein
LARGCFFAFRPGLVRTLRMPAGAIDAILVAILVIAS